MEGRNRIKNLTLRLVTPAFLAGAEAENPQTCELRPATLRGQLRWWWRTLHADHLNPVDLKRLEAVIWGDTEQGGAARITVVPANGQQAPKVKAFDRQRIILANRLPEPPTNKITQGLVYVVGKKWKQLLNEQNPESDMVRYEIEKARQGKATFFTVLVDGVSNRILSSLPQELQFLKSLNSHTLGTTNDFREQISRLVKTVAGCIDPRVSVDMVPVPAGEYSIGSDAGESYEKPVNIRLTKRFRINRWYLTMRELELLLGQGHIPRSFPRDQDVGGDLLPAHNLSWFDAINVCNRMSRQNSLKEFYDLNAGRVVVPDWSAHGFRLPTEAEWEVACQLGLFGIDLENFSPDAISAVFGLDSTDAEPVAIGDPRIRQDKAGCFGMLGNIREWCFDSFSLDAYDEFRAMAIGGHCVDPVHNLDVEPDHVVRGGCYCDPESLIRPWRRHGFSAFRRDPGNGMRLVQTCEC